MDSTIQAILGKIWSKNAPELQPGLTEVSGQYLLTVSGVVEKGDDSDRVGFHVPGDMRV